jgi:hypothetical protein
MMLMEIGKMRLDEYIHQQLDERGRMDNMLSAGGLADEIQEIIVKLGTVSKSMTKDYRFKNLANQIQSVTKTLSSVARKLEDNERDDERDSKYD